MNSLWLLHGLATPVLLVLLVQAVRPGENGLRTTLGAGRALFFSRSGRPALGVILLVLLVNSVECLYDGQLSAWLGYDIAPLVRSLEGDLVEQVQGAVPPSWIPPLAFVYVSGYVAWILLPAVVYTHTGARTALTGLLLGFLANYLLAVPFYLFFPVAEPAFSSASEARALIDEVWPGITAEMRIASALDNCFPSLHVSCSVTTLWFAWRHGGARLRVLGVLFVPAITLSVMALGIHWGLDVASGIAHGLLCAFLGETLALPVLRRFGHAGCDPPPPDVP